MNIRDIHCLNDIEVLDKIILFNNDYRFINSSQNPSHNSSHNSSIPIDKEILDKYIIDENNCKYSYYNNIERVRCFVNINKNIFIKEYTNISDSGLDKIISGFLMQVKLYYGIKENKVEENKVEENKIEVIHSLSKYQNNICKVCDIKFYKN